MQNTKAELPNWSRAFDGPVFHGLIKQSPSDFQVDEELGFEFSGTGEHDLLHIEKTGANTAWVAQALSRHAGVSEKDVGYSGLKDRHAVTRQWFSVRRLTGEGSAWERFELPGVQIVDSQRNGRKLKRGAHTANVFRLKVRDVRVERDDLDERLANIQRDGVPNYFGAQRFGRNGGNLKLAADVLAGKRVRRNKRSIAISAARSFLFNEILSARVTDGSWNQIRDGEALNLDGTNSFFVVDKVDDELQSRLDALDVHPTGAMWGTGESQCTGEAESFERAIVDSAPDFAGGLERLGAKAGRRSLRLPVADLEWNFSEGILELNFRLRRGAYATSVLRELMQDDVE